MRDFHSDFLMPAIAGLTDPNTHRVAVALDTAVMFGALEALEMIEKTPRGLWTVLGATPTQLQEKYEENVRRLKSLEGGVTVDFPPSPPSFDPLESVKDLLPVLLNIANANRPTRLERIVTALMSRPGPLWPATGTPADLVAVAVEVDRALSFAETPRPHGSELTS